MSQTLDLGPRAELVSMDSHCDDITIALYRPESDQGPVYKVHTYSKLPSAAARIAGLRADSATEHATLRRRQWKRLQGRASPRRRTPLLRDPLGIIELERNQHVAHRAAAARVEQEQVEGPLRGV